MSTQSFADLGISSAIVDVLNRQGIDSPFPVQRMVIPDALAGHDMLVKSPTGSGKTLAFAAPIVDRIEPSERGPVALVIAPTRELTRQIVEQTQPLARARGISIAPVYGGVGLERQAKRARRAQFVVATPGRLLDLLARRTLSLDGVRILVLDEADRMLDMGFRPDVDRIVAQIPSERQTLLFSATLGHEVSRIADAYTRSPRRHEHAPVQSAGRIEHRFIAVSHESKLDALVGELRNDERGLALVFVRTKRGADRLVKRLASHGIGAAAMHGNKSQSQRQKALSRFDAGDVDALVATDVAARGIDVDGISHVINFDPPHDRDGYLHRVGRTARAGRSGVGVTLVLHEQRAEVGAIAHQLDLRRQLASAGIANVSSGGRTRNANGGGARNGRRPPRPGRSGTRRRRRRRGQHRSA